LKRLTDTLEQQVAERTEALQKTQLQLIQQEKLSALGQLVAGVAHEINNPIGCILGNVHSLQDYINDLLAIIDFYQNKCPQLSVDFEAELEAFDLDYIQDDLPNLIQAMKDGSDRIRHISTSLRTFSRTDKDQKIPFNLHEGLDSTILILKHRLKANDKRPAIKIVKEYGNLPAVQCFPGQLNQVFMNLIANSIDALEESNQGRSFEEISANPNQITIVTEVTSEQVIVRIADNGTGMGKEVRQRIFEQGFTTKAVGKGTGLGLAIARQIMVDKHEGYLKVQSQIGQGTEFLICLPIEWRGRHHK
jgi:signal transduction histidine kinase